MRNHYGECVIHLYTEKWRVKILPFFRFEKNKKFEFLSSMNWEHRKKSWKKSWFLKKNIYNSECWWIRF